ncbi:Hpt domain-containing protein [Sulfurovum sp. bin170]|uniref:Hpt domain-containing protein n=1 Tax=Sulfurovum sp. bin170 TaxID=2695268 RepID=UPI0013DFFAE9|nr:Hpt domain-containing protein [Sulfurovum sp. bin170]NEW60233.1 Hpt domain-containing protein [Sulfurovum sp. bin170]
MYYGYNNKKQITMADQEFIELLGYRNFSDIIKNDIAQSVKFENGKIYLKLSDKAIKANYSETAFLTNSDSIKVLKLSNIIETKNSVSKLQLNYHPIYLDVQKISSDIGLSIDDYKLYLDSFIDQSIIDEKKLLDGDDRAIKNLSNLALTLKVPNINILLLKIKKLPSGERSQYIDEYYTRLALLTLKKPIADSVVERDTPSLDTKNTKEEELNSKFTELLSNVEEPPLNEKKEEKLNNIKADAIDLDMDMDMDLDFNLDDELVPLTDISIKKIEEPKSNVEKISLENIIPLPIDYNPKVAADELNLPVVLIEEFVEDFIEQAHHDKDHLLASYYQKDMDNIHELGHKLKGAASNLRINELADVLEEIQFCTEHLKLKSLFIKYWGLFISLENYMKQPKQ